MNSETVSPRPDKTVLHWIEAQTPSSPFLVAETIGQLVRGARQAREQAFRERFERWIEQDPARQFDGRILPFEAPAAAVRGRLMGDREGTGRRRSAADAQVAAAAMQHGLTLVTRNVKDFRSFDIRLLDPWQHLEDGQ